MQTFLTNLVNSFAQSWLYVDFMSKLPEGLNNPYLDFLLVAIFIAIIVVSVFEIVQSAIWRARRAQKAETLREEMEQKKTKEEQMMEMMSKALEKMGEGGAPGEIPDEMWMDPLGVYNNMAFKRDFDKISEDGLCIVFFDVNNLKKTNDSMGHDCGDILLRSVCCSIKDIFGSCYRKGGDEFIYMTNNEPYTSIESKLEKLRNHMTELTGSDERGIIYETAAGYCINDGSMTKDEVLNYADKEMYKNKQELKATKPMTNVADLYAPQKLSEDGLKVNVPTFGTQPVQEAPKPKKTDMTNKNLALFGDTELTDAADDSEIYDLKETEAVNDDLANLREKPKEEEEIFDANALLKEKMAEAPTQTYDEDPANAFAAILSNIEKDAEEKKRMQELSEQEKSVKDQNMQILEKKVKSSMQVEGSGNSYDNAAVLRAQEKELERRREEARREEEKARKGKRG